MNITRIENPNQTLQGEERETLVEKLVDIARDGFGSEITQDDVENHVLTVDLLYLIENEGELVAFSSYDFLEVEGEQVLYLSGIVVKQDKQQRGIFEEVNRDAMG